MQKNSSITKTPLRGLEVLGNPSLNKGTAFSTSSIMVAPRWNARRIYTPGSRDNFIIRSTEIGCVRKGEE
jgi:hypothetical protein